MALSLLLVAPALALTWYTADEAEAGRVRAALGAVWPEAPVAVVVGPPQAEDPEGAVWWDGEALILARDADRRRAPGVADPSVQAAMLRGWLARAAPAVEAPPARPTPAPAPPPPPPPDAAWILVFGGGPLLVLPDPRAGLALDALGGRRQGPLFLGALLSGGLGLGERGGAAGAGYALSRLDLELCPGLRLGLGPSASLWALAGGGARLWVARDRQGDAPTYSQAWTGSAGLQLLVETEAGAVGARARLLTAAPAAPDTLTLAEESVTLRPGGVSLALTLAPGVRP